MKKTLLIVTLLFISIVGHSQTFISGKLTYEVISTQPNKVKVIDYNTTGGTTVVIPSSVTRHILGTGGIGITYSVTEIGANAFKYNSLVNVTIPNSVISIRNGAFEDNYLTNVLIPDSVISIGYKAFKDNLLTDISFSSALTIIGYEAFKNNQIAL